MDKTTQAYLVIGFIDITYCILVIASYVNDVFQYMNRFYMSIFKITLEFHENSLLARVPGFYLDFNSFFCESRSNMEFKEICDNYQSFYNASIIYLSLTLACFFLVIYGLLHFMSVSLDWRQKKCFQLSFCHYAYPILHTLAVLLYLWVSNYYSLTPPSGFSVSYQVNAKAGLFLMMFAEVVSVIGLFVYLFTQTSNKSDDDSSNEDITDEGYKKIEDNPSENVKKLPSLPVEEEFSSDDSGESDKISPGELESEGNGENEKKIRIKVVTEENSSSESDSD